MTRYQVQWEIGHAAAPECFRWACESNHGSRDAAIEQARVLHEYWNVSGEGVELRGGRHLRIRVLEPVWESEKSGAEGEGHN